MNNVRRLEPIHLKSLRDHVHDTLREAIISGRFRTDEKLNERQLAAELGISTTPLKEALRQLETEGLVRTEARRGSYVTFNARQAEEMMLARAALESVMAQQAARHATDVQIALMKTHIEQMRAALQAADIARLIELNEFFHDTIHDASSCEYLRRLQNGQRMYDHAARITVLADENERVRSFAEHEAIMLAIAERNEDEAERLMREHVMLAGEKHLITVFSYTPAEKRK